jgi:hypothetical protein
MLFKAEASRGPELRLRVPRIRWRGERVFRAAVRGDVDTIKALLISGEASPFDVSSSSGLSALQASSLINTYGVAANLVLVCYWIHAS